ncbi:ubiquitin carboxyl-terminal hydrolase 47-like isoform X2 [Gymnodraco acuticeps]|uniref:Ubiquitin carboxyl-terminal hydrolase n=1 Tax=Gymnodraco acuticeps TaxID=8218 RepID=A0A6P8U042_GYMAC|nr:ubiquitin carboxyl-terminal hydrolase 47-like isoform X2 [Gymnodraco acuticeps]
MSISRKRSHEEGKAPAKKPKGKEDAVIQLHYGLYNQGATCYLNSVLQVLFMTPELHDRLDPKSWITDQELGEVFKKIKVENCGTEEITESLGITNVHQQCDAAECLELILHKVSPNASEVFQGQLIYMTKCSKGHIINEETNPFWTLPLSLRNTHDATYNVERGFERTFETKSYSGDNMVYCNECEKKTEATSILVLLLKRFELDFNIMSYFKSDCSVDVPYTLQKKDKKYSLYGMVNHYGSLRGGHYTATLLSNEDKTWYEFNDEAVNKVEEQSFAKTGTYSSSSAYLLVYRESLKDEGKDQRGRTHDDKENRHESQDQDRQIQISKDTKKPKDQTRYEKVSTFNNEDVLPKQKTDANNVEIVMEDDLPNPKTSKMEVEEGETTKDKDRQPPSNRFFGIKRNHIYIALGAIASIVIVISVVLATTLKN